MQSGSTPDDPSSAFWRRFADAGALRRVAVTLAILALYQLGRLIPAYGINPEFAFPSNAAVEGLSSDLWPTLTYFSLQLTPLFSLLMLVEVFKLAFADVREWATEHQRTRYQLNKGVLVAALGLAAIQAYGLSAALEGLPYSYGAQSTLPVLEPRPQFRWSYIGGVVAATALCVWFADQITRHGIGSGFWLLFLLPSMIGLAAVPAYLFAVVQTGEVASSAAIGFAVVLVLSAAAIICLTRKWAATIPRRPSSQGFDYSSDMARILIWPPFIAASVTGLVAAFLNFLLALDPEVAGGTQLMQRGSIGSAISIVVLITVLIYAIAYGVLDGSTHTEPETQKLLALTAVTASATCIAIDVLVSQFVPVQLSGSIWIAIISVFALLLPSDVREILPDEQNDPDPNLSDEDVSAA